MTRKRIIEDDFKAPPVEAAHHLKKIADELDAKASEIWVVIKITEKFTEAKLEES
jgi:hypothetical protein